MTTLAGRLPKGEGDGLGPILTDLLHDPHKVHVVIALVDCKSTKIDHESGDRVPTVRVKRIEVVLPEDRARARQILDRGYERRLGKATLPFELEEDLRSAFDDDGGES